MRMDTGFGDFAVSCFSRVGEGLGRGMSLPRSLARSHMSGRSREVLSLSLGGGSLKLLACRDHRVLGWGITPITRGLLREGFVSDSEGFAGVIREMLSEKGFSRRWRAIASLPAFHSVCSLMEVPNSRDVRSDIVIPQQAKRQMGYSAENSLLFWQRLKKTAARQQFLVLSVPREPVITLFDAIKLAGLHITDIEPCSFSLARAVNQPNAIIVSVEMSSLDIVVIVDAIPVATQSRFLVNEPLNDDMFRLNITDAIANTIVSYDDAHPGRPLPADIPLCLVGSALPLYPDIVSVVKANSRNPILEFSPPILHSEDFPVGEMAVNIGLALREKYRRR